jgi:fatty-acyl-CoA synthase
MRGLMMDYPLSIPAMVRRAQTLFGDRIVVSRRPDRSVARATYAEVIGRSKRLGMALQRLGVQPGDRVATLAYSSQQHLEAYLAIPSIDAVLHTLNLRLHHDDLAFIARDAADRVLIVDESLLPLCEQFKARAGFDAVIVIGSSPRADGYLDYEDLLAGVDLSQHSETEVPEEHAAAMCYTSGTTGRPKGVLYSHRAIVLHSFGQGLVDTLAIGEQDTVLPIVPMFHVNAWGLPFTCTLLGARQVFAGPHVDPQSIIELLVSERVTLTAGVPTVWLGLLQELDAHPGEHDLSRLRAIVVGGSAAPVSMIRAFKERHGLDIVHAWGMTEMTPVGTLCNLPAALRDAPPEIQYRHRARQGKPLPFVEIRARTDQGLAPWDGETMGELEVRGPWVARQYYHGDGDDCRFTTDGWFRTGDIVTIDEAGCIELTDRAKDLVKSGGEWISSVALENALMGHPAVQEAAVIAVPHPKWGERPLAVVVVKAGRAVTQAELLAFLDQDFARWWLPDTIEFVSEIPRTSAGKFRKSALRDSYRQRYQPPG